MQKQYRQFCVTLSECLFYQRRTASRALCRMQSARKMMPRSGCDGESMGGGQMRLMACRYQARRAGVIAEGGKITTPLLFVSRRA
uniref:Uncharacterized protein n=1 Tax=Salmonella sp. TaxID=599 RepID=A0A482ETC5_SALSP|nr:hypothetical protein NNIBIDOC_00128 [Salmonella sp.]